MRKVYEHRIYVNGSEITIHKIQGEVNSGEFDYFPTQKMKEHYKNDKTLPSTYPKKWENVPHKNLIFYSVFTTNPMEEDNILLKLREYVDNEYRRQQSQLEYELDKTKAIIGNMWQAEVSE